MPRSRSRSRSRSKSRHHSRHHSKHHSKHRSRRRSRKAGKSKRKLSAWQKLVKKTLREGKCKDKNYNLGNALRDAKKVYKK